jgi:hypothetical protein
MSAKPRARPLTAADFERLAEFRYLLRHFMIFSEDAAEETGLTLERILVSGEVSLGIEARL